ncbi:MAG: class I SAM-dependent methyltransferase [Candidatus Eremiobacterota bacterium]
MRTDDPVPQTPDVYDHYTSAFTRPWDDLILQRVVEEWRKMGRSHGTLLDVGTGTAVLLVMAARRPELDGLKLLGLDYFDSMVAKARASVAGQGLADRIEILQADAQSTGLPDGCAHLIMSRATIHHVRNPSEAYQEMYRLLAPGGVAVVHDMRRDPAPEALAEFEELRARAGIKPTILEQKYTVEETRKQLQDAGLEYASSVAWGKSGAAALGFEVRLERREGHSG